MTAEKPAIEYVTKCRKCGKPFRTEQFLPIVGTQDSRLFRFIDALKQHIEKHHPEIGMEVGMFSAFLIAAAYEITDPFLIDMREGLRSTLHRATRRAFITDEQITERVSSLTFSQESQERVQALIRDMRDILCEQGEYAPQPAPNPLVEA